MYPGELAVSIRKYVYAVLLPAQPVPFPHLSRMRLGGGNRTIWSSSITNYTYTRIDKAGQAGYPRAA
jgi:hypothetical protein